MLDRKKSWGNIFKTFGNCKRWERHKQGWLFCFVFEQADCTNVWSLPYDMDHYQWQSDSWNECPSANGTVPTISFVLNNSFHVIGQLQISMIYNLHSCWCFKSAGLCIFIYIVWKRYGIFRITNYNIYHSKTIGHEQM